jgi:methionyl-tRNA formyltransferase
MKDVKVVLIGIIDSKGSLINKKFYFTMGYGIIQSIKMGLKYGEYKLADIISRNIKSSIFKNKRSIKTICREHNISYEVIKDPNDEIFINRLDKIAPDLIISFSSPSKFKNSLLKLPKIGCINLHCSLLPLYAGLWPGFWVLYNSENETGATVHMMDDKIDTGGIINQEKIEINHKMSVFEVLKITKYVGGELMVKTIRDLQNDHLNVYENKSCEKKYFSWPSIQDLKRFRKNGGKFI